MRNGENPQAVNTIECILECAVCLNWKDIASRSLPTVMQLEYRIGPTHSLEFLKLWSSTSRGYWNLVCEYSMEPTITRQQGITFSGTYSSPGLSRMLDAIMHHQGAFSLNSAELFGGLVQIASPDETRSAAARIQMSQALARITSRKPPGEMTAAMRSAADHPALPLSISNRGIN